MTAPANGSPTSNAPARASSAITSTVISRRCTAAATSTSEYAEREQRGRGPQPVGDPARADQPGAPTAGEQRQGRDEERGGAVLPQ